MTTTETPSALIVGQEGTYVVGIRGPITAAGDGTVTIGGHTLPIRLGDGVVYASTVLPDVPTTIVLDECDCAEVVERLPDSVVDAVHRMHDDEHQGAFIHCSHEVCREVEG